MSRIGNQSVKLFEGVEVIFRDNFLKVKGLKGELSQEVCEGITFEIGEGEVKVINERKEKYYKAMHGLYRSLLNNMVRGVTHGFEKRLELNGVGYRASLKDGVLDLLVGYSHKVNFILPEGIECEVQDNILIILKSYDKQLLGETAARIRRIKLPDVYKKKGVRYVGEVIKTKVGKSGK